MALLLAWPHALRADIEALVDILTEPGSAGLGVLVGARPALYKAGEAQLDLLPLYLYEGERLFLHASRWGIKVLKRPESRLDLILDYRFEGFPGEEIPDSLRGMQPRMGTADAGLAYRHELPWGQLRLELLHDVFKVHRGSEVRLGYRYDWARGRLLLRPNAMLHWRSAQLNDYYYGVQQAEALPGRPAYQADGGLAASIGLYAYYRLTKGWRLLGGGEVHYLGADARDSPIVETHLQPTIYLGAAYDFGSHQSFEKEGGPVYIKALYGLSTGCILREILTLECVSTHTLDHTTIAGLELGKPFVERVNDWPVDFIGYLSVIRHLERGLQNDSWQFNAYIKGVYYGFPWSHRVKTRIGFGFGLSIAERIPFSEAQEAAASGQSTSKLLTFFDPTIDMSIGDIIGVKRLAETFLGLGVSHRSGIFGASQLFRNVYSGSNYLYLYVETKL